MATTNCRPWILLAVAAATVVLAQPVSSISSADLTSPNSPLSDPADTIVCVYPISGQYCLLNRLLFYSLIVFATLSQRWTWLSVGAVAYVLNYSGTAAVHAFLLLIVGRGDALDLDGLAVWCILSPVAVTIAPSIYLSKKIRQGKYRALFGIWAISIIAGLTPASVAFYRHVPEEPICRATVGGSGSISTLTTRSQLPFWNVSQCTYTCFDSRQAMRSQAEMVAVDVSQLYSEKFGRLLWAWAITVLFGCFLGTSCLHHLLDVNNARFNYGHIYAPEYADYPRLSAESDGERKLSRRLRKQEFVLDYWHVNHPMPKPWPVYLNFPAFAIVVTLNEAYATSKDVPGGESAFAVGQWSPWVVISLALIASGINIWYAPKLKKLMGLFAEDEEDVEEEKDTSVEHNTQPWMYGVYCLMRRTSDQIYTFFNPSRDTQTKSGPRHWASGLRRAVGLAYRQSLRPKLAPMESWYMEPQSQDETSTSGIN